MLAQATSGAAAADYSRPARLLVTGHRGFVGQALQAWLPDSPWASRVAVLTLPVGLDIRDTERLQAAVADARPDFVLHLAAQSFVPAAFDDPRNTLDVNVLGTLSLLQALSAQAFGGRLLYVSSADVYGAVADGSLPVAETQLPAPRNPYAVSKVAAELLCQQWHFAHGLDVVIARPFNHTGPGQDARFALSGFARGIARIALGRAPARIDTGNLAVTRDFSDVRDVLDAYLVLLHAGRAGQLYNVCSGVERSLDGLLATMLAGAGVQAEVVTDPSRLRPNEQLRMVGSHRKLVADTGWAPRCDFDQTLAAMVAWWRHKEMDL